MPEEINLSPEEEDALDRAWEKLSSIEYLWEDEEDNLLDEDDPTLSIDKHGREHAPAGSGKGGQFVSKNVLVREVAGFIGGGVTTVAGTWLGFLIGGPYAATILGTIIGTVGAVVGRIVGDAIFPVFFTPDKPTRVSIEDHVATIDKAIAKFNINPEPTEEEIEENKDAIEDIGTRDYNRNLGGNSKDRAARRNKLMKEFGDGESCPCVYCGLIVGEGTLIQSKMYTTKQGGRYRQANLVPSCVDCSRRRGEMPFDEAIEKIVSFTRRETADARKQSTL